MSIEPSPPAPPTPASVGRTALLRATIAVGLAEGLSGITSRSVAETAGVAHSLVRYHFGSIDALVTEALGLAIDEGMAHGQRLASTTTLAEFAENLATSVTAHRDTHAFLHEALLESRRRPELYPQVERYFRDYRGAISAQLVRLGVQDSGLIDIVYFVVEGMTFKEITYPDQAGTRGAMVRLQRLIAEMTGVPIGDVGAFGERSDVTDDETGDAEAAPGENTDADATATEPTDAAAGDEAPGAGERVDPAGERPSA